MVGVYMREYKIKRGHNPDINALISEYFGTNGDLQNGVDFAVNGIGTIHMKSDNKSLFVDIEFRSPIKS